jgi:hypothetical protein
MKQEPLFDAGVLFPLASAKSLVPERVIWQLFARHERGDWGLTIAKDPAHANAARRWNETALEKGGQIVSRYRVDEYDLVLVTQANRLVTACMTWEDYNVFFGKKPMNIPEEIVEHLKQEQTLKSTLTQEHTTPKHTR